MQHRPQRAFATPLVAPPLVAAPVVVAPVVVVPGAATGASGPHA